MTELHIQALLGGVIIGIAATLLLWLNGRIAGNSGIIAQVFPLDQASSWRLFYLLGLIAGGFAYRILFPGQLTLVYNPSLIMLIVAGLLVGFGTRLGGGCTSGHGICGIARLSPRSIAATVIFVAVAMATVWIVRLTGGVWW